MCSKNRTFGPYEPVIVDVSSENKRTSVLHVSADHDANYAKSQTFSSGAIQGCCGCKEMNKTLAMEYKVYSVTKPSRAD